MITLAILGRPNVGKSTLFNRLAGKKLAIVDDRPGVTRDWREAEGSLFDLSLRIIDTAGLEDAQDDSLEARMRRQTESALAQTDVLLFVIDGREGVTPLDRHFANWARRQGKPVILVVNKCENLDAAASGMAEAYALGLGDPVALSSAHGDGFDDLYEALLPFEKKELADNGDENEDGEILPENIDDIEGREDFEFAPAPEDPAKPIKIAIAGRPNSGKSTLLNTLIGQERVMTGPEAGTTRDAIAVKWQHGTRALRLVDTAGLRRKARITDEVEKMATGDTLRAIRLAQVVILVLDARYSLEKQDLTIADHIVDEGRGLVIALNKWDLIENKEETLQKFRDDLERSLGQLPEVPFITMSALHGANTQKLLDKVIETYDLWASRIKTAKMNRWLAARESQNPPPLSAGRANRLRYITQIKSKPPTFALWCSKPDDLPDSYKRYLMNGLRRDFGLPGIPLRLLARTSKNPYADK